MVERSDLEEWRVDVLSHVLLRRVEDESVALDLEDESYYHFDGVATAMVEALTNSASAAEALRKLQEEFDVDPATLTKDLCVFVEQCEELGLLAVVAV